METLSAVRNGDLPTSIKNLEHTTIPRGKKGVGVGRLRSPTLTHEFSEGGGVFTTPGCAVHAKVRLRYKHAFEAYLRWRGFLISSFSKSDALSPCCLIFFRSVYLPQSANGGGGGAVLGRPRYFVHTSTRYRLHDQRYFECFKSLHHTRCSHSHPCASKFGHSASSRRSSSQSMMLSELPFPPPMLTGRGA